MSPSLIVVSLGAVVAAAGTGVLVARCVRTPRAHLVSWSLAIFGLAVALGAQAIGDLSGYGSLMFRAMELGAQLVAPLALCLGLVELVGRSVAARFAMRLAVSAIAVIAFVILGTDPLNQSVTFSTRWPDPGVYYQLPPKAVLEFLAPFTLITAAAATFVILARSRADRAARAAVRPVATASAAAALLAVPGLALLAQSRGVNLSLSGRSVFALACTAATGLTWFAAVASARLDRSAARARERGARQDERWPGEPRDGGDDPHATGEYDGFERADRDGRHFDADRGTERRGAPHHGDADLDWDELAADRPVDHAANQVRYPGLAALAAGTDGPPGGAGHFGDADRHGDGDRYGDGDQYGDGDRYGDGDGLAERGRYGADDLGYEGGDPYADRAGHDAAAGHRDSGRSAGHDRYEPPVAGPPPAQLFGEITIYTLIEDRTREFDRLTERIVAQVREQEPDTLAYIVHAVPTAPLQRILYEVYRDRVAYDDHLRQPYIVRYEAERRPFVLATNVIELGLQHVKVSAFPSFSAISDILSESGIDLTGVTRSSRGARPASPSPGVPGRAPPLPHADPPEAPWSAPRPAGEPGYERQYQGWDEIRHVDRRHR